MALGAKKIVLRQVLGGLHYMHQHGYCHQDLSMDNVVVPGNGISVVAQLVDFGVARKVEAQGMSTAKNFQKRGSKSSLVSAFIVFLISTYFSNTVK